MRVLPPLCRIIAALVLGTGLVLSAEGLRPNHRAFGRCAALCRGAGQDGRGERAVARASRGNGLPVI